MLTYLYINDDIIWDNYTYTLIQYYSNIYIDKGESSEHTSLLLIIMESFSPEFRGLRNPKMSCGCVR